MEAVEVKTTDGALRGERTSAGVAVFRGIPYAAPATGERRYRPPAPVEPWSGVRDATQFGPAAMQGQRRAAAGVFAGAFGPADLGLSEDCLSLNVWTPATDGAKRPVMVWIHGGAFRMGTGASPGYDGTTLVRRGDIVLVTLNYRLGVLGFLHAPEIGSVNLGLLDQVAALEWVQREIEAFGGDPAQVTIFGESAGGKSVECLLAMPRARGLFRRAIAQSTYAPPMDPDAAAERARSLATRLGLAGLEDLRRVPAEDLLDADAQLLLETARGGAPGGAGPVVDGEILPSLPIDGVAAGAAADVPLLVGTTLDEARLFGAFAGGADAATLDESALTARVGDLVGPDADPTQVIALYRETLAAAVEPSEPADIVSAITTDKMFRQHSIRLASAQAGRQASTFMYLFGWKSRAMDGRLGACHGIELPFVFGTHDAPLGRLAGDGPDARRLAEAVQDAWLSFATTGRPTSPLLPEWPAYDDTDRATMLLGAESRRARAPFDEVRRWWDGRPLAAR